MDGMVRWGAQVLWVLGNWASGCTKAESSLYIFALTPGYWASRPIEDAAFIQVADQISLRRAPHPSIGDVPDPVHLSVKDVAILIAIPANPIAGCIEERSHQSEVCARKPARHNVLQGYRCNSFEEQSDNTRVKERIGPNGFDLDRCA
jgi:hypothetical protein